ncbi:hypothetical protein H8S90_19430 [Olivibacter sp. SDN3]|uniref:hypothetical protein n=1 Tax=Olivibacter sp. SDN3 TaxID=2764720 RepID=UPI001650F4D8|nr:hypothetical protein [Olivibacter sp. SDN3]QNL48906.1 hypothetical protein H8S90_19430 [Olivibacter sp. SDN3]
MSKKRWIWIGAAILSIAAFILKDSFLQPNAEDLKGGFKEIVFARSEQNAGPIIRLYVVSVKDEKNAQMQSYGDLMPHTKYGTTKVFFFNAEKPIPQRINLQPPHFDTTIYKASSRYEKRPMGGTLLLNFNMY